MVLKLKHNTLFPGFGAPLIRSESINYAISTIMSVVTFWRRSIGVEKMGVYVFIMGEFVRHAVFQWAGHVCSKFDDQ